MTTPSPLWLPESCRATEEPVPPEEATEPKSEFLSHDDLDIAVSIRCKKCGVGVPAWRCIGAPPPKEGRFRLWCSGCGLWFEIEDRMSGHVETLT